MKKGNVKKGFLSFLIVLVFIFAIVIAASSYTVARHNDNWQPLSVDTLYYKMQDVKHAHFLAAKRGGEEGVAIHNAEFTTCYVGCITEKCIASGGAGCVEDLILAGDPDCNRECKNSLPKIEDTVKERINSELNSLSETDFEEGDRYIINRWYACETAGAMNSLAEKLKKNPSYTQWDTNSNEYVMFDVANPITGEIKVRFESSLNRTQGEVCVIGFTVLDTYSNVSLVGYIPDTESFNVCCAYSEAGDAGEVKIEDIAKVLEETQ